MTIQSIIDILESWAPLNLSESYDNAGLITGDASQPVRGILVCLDSTEIIVQEAIDLGCNMIIAHHPIVFKGLKKITGTNFVERTVLKAIRAEIAIYALHTNLDNISTGVNYKIAQRLELRNQSILLPNQLHGAQEKSNTGAGIQGELPGPYTGVALLQMVKDKLKLDWIKHTALPGKTLNNIAVCGGAGSFLIPVALEKGVDVLLTSDLKYHEYFEADGRLLILDIGHYESERFTIDLIEEYLESRVIQVPIFKTKMTTNPVHYFL